MEAVKTRTQPKMKEWPLGHGGRGCAGPGRPREPNPANFDDSGHGEKLEKKNGNRKDVAREIAHEVFAQNKREIYRAMAKRAMKGDSKAFVALANRAYGLPVQELSFDQDRPFKLVIEVIGTKKEPQVIEAQPVNGHKRLTDGDNDNEDEQGE